MEKLPLPDQQLGTDPLCSRLAFGRCREMMRELLLANRDYIQNPRLLEFA